MKQEINTIPRGVGYRFGIDGAEPVNGDISKHWHSVKGRRRSGSTYTFIATIEGHMDVWEEDGEAISGLNIFVVCPGRHLFNGIWYTIRVENGDLSHFNFRLGEPYELPFNYQCDLLKVYLEHHTRKEKQS